MVFRLAASGRPDVLTSDSERANDLVNGQGYTLKDVEFANETDRPGVTAVMSYVSKSGDRIYTLDTSEQAQLDGDANWTRERRAFGAFNRSWPGLSPVYRFYDHSTGRHVFSIDSEAGVKLGDAENQGIAWYAALFVKPPAHEGGSGGGAMGLFGLAGGLLLLGYRRFAGGRRRRQ